MKLLKRVLTGILILLTLLVVSLFAFLAYYKNSLKEKLITGLRQNYGLCLTVDNIRVSLFSNWPHASVQLNKVLLSNDSSNKQPPVLRAGSLSLSFSIKRLMHREFIVNSVSVKDADLMMITDGNQLSNFKFKTRAAVSQNQEPVRFEINSINLQNIRYRFSNTGNGQNVHLLCFNNTLKLKHYLEGMSVVSEGKLLVHELLFNPAKGAFFKNIKVNAHLYMNYFNSEKVLNLHAPSCFDIESQNYNLVAHLKLGSEKKLALQVSGKNIWFEKAVRLLNSKIQKSFSNFTIKKPLNADITLVSNLGKKEEPAMLIHVNAVNSDLTIGNSKIPYSELSFSGRVVSLDSSHTRGDAEHARIIFNSIKGKIYNFPFTASLTVTNFNKPFLNLKGAMQINAAKINSKLKNEFALSGLAQATIQYCGPTSKLNRNEFLSRNMTLQAEVVFKNLSYREIQRPYKYTLNGKALVNNKDLSFEKLSLTTDAGEVWLKGNAEGFVNYVLGYSNALRANIAAKAEKLDLNPYLAPLPRSKEETKPTGNSAGQVAKSAASQSRFEFNVILNANRVLIRKVQGTGAFFNLAYRTNFLEVKSASMNAFEGRMDARGSMENFRKINAQIQVTDVNVNKLFEQMDNFNQSAVKSEHLKGTMLIDATLKASLDDNLQVMGESMLGEVKLKLKDGHLLNFEPVQHLSDFVFKNRDFNDISFSELDETFKIKGYEMHIDELEIASNVLNLYVVNGIYNFKGQSTINVLIPWSNLRKRNKSFIAKSLGLSSENVKGLKLCFYGQPAKLRIGLGHRPLNQ